MDSVWYNRIHRKRNAVHRVSRTGTGDLIR